MSGNSIGEKLKVTIFGQSHGPAIGAVIEGFPAGMKIDWEALSAFMDRRAPGKNAWSTQRKEGDKPEILSGLNGENITSGAPITAVIENTNAHSKDYPDLTVVPRPGHADFAATLKYGENWDYRGGGPFSGRLTAPICFAGALCKQYLKETYGMEIAAYIARIGSVWGGIANTEHPALPFYAAGDFPVLRPAFGDKMKEEIEEARKNGDSVDGEIRCVVTGMPGGIGGPLFAGVEGKLALGLFGIPAVKGLKFGDTQMHGSENNDPFCVENDEIRTTTNHHGGILGGITTGMPLHFTVFMKPTPSIAKTQKSVNIREKRETEISMQGRHDPCVVPRAVPVVEASAIFWTGL